jgi:hypothetical protein
MGRTPIFEVRVRGWLGATGATWFEGLRVTPTAGGDTLIAGRLPDQSSLHGVLARIRDLGLVLVSVEVRDAGDAPQLDREV